MAESSRKSQAFNTRQCLREAARREFANRGVGATTVDHIAAAAGYSRGAFYANYENKQQLLLELVAEKHDSEIDIWRSLIASASCLDDALDALECRFSEYAQSSENWRLAAEMELEMIRNPDFDELYRKHSESLRDRVDGLIGKLCRLAGVTSVNAELLSLSLRALSMGTIFEGAQTWSTRSPGKIIRCFLSNALSSAPS